MIIINDLVAMHWSMQPLLGAIVTWIWKEIMKLSVCQWRDWDDTCKPDFEAFMEADMQVIPT